LILFGRMVALSLIRRSYERVGLHQAQTVP
jgi:hypothetical protein